MRYSQIRSMDISNGKGVGCSLFVQGCEFHCKNCFNPDTWDFNGGKKWTDDTKKNLLQLVDRPYIKRISILGGEPLAESNLKDILDLVTEIRKTYPTKTLDTADGIVASHNILCEKTEEIRASLPEKTIWLYTGYMWEELFSASYSKDYICTTTADRDAIYRQLIIKNVDVLVDGRYIDSQRDITLKWRGSKNQRVIDVQRSLDKGEIILWTE